MRNIVLTGILFLLAFSASAQKITLSEKEELNLSKDDFMVIGKCRNYTAIYKNHTAIGEIVFYDKNFIKEKISTLSFLPEAISKIYFSATANKLSIFYVLRENKIVNVYMAKLKEDYSWTVPVLLDSSPAGAYRTNNEYVFCSSEDKTKTLVFNSFVENSASILHAKVIDLDLNVLTQIEQSFAENNFDLSDVGNVTNNGNAYIVSTDDRTAKGSAEKLSLLSCAKGANAFTNTTLNLTNYSVSDLHLATDNANQNIYLCGYFSDGRFSSPRGLYFSVFDEEKQLISSNHFTPLALQISSSHSDLRDMKIRNVFLKKTGEIEIAAEKTYQNTRNIGGLTPILSSSYMMSNITENTRTVHEFSYDEIVLFNLKTDGSLAWTQNVLKEQTTMDDNGIFSSYGVLQNHLGNAYIFSDVSSKQSRLLACYVSANGELTVKELQTSEEEDNWSLMPRSAVQVSKSEIIMPCVSKSYLCFLKISY